MAELPQEMIKRIRQSGRVQGIEEMREELFRHIKGNDVVIPVTELTTLVEKLEK